MPPCWLYASSGAQRLSRRSWLFGVRLHARISGRGTKGLQTQRAVCAQPLGLRGKAPRSRPPRPFPPPLVNPFTHPVTGVASSDGAAAPRLAASGLTRLRASASRSSSPLVPAMTPTSSNASASTPATSTSATSCASGSTPDPSPPCARSPAKLVPTGRITEGHVTTVMCDRERVRALLAAAKKNESDASFWRGAARDAARDAKKLAPKPTQPAAKAKVARGSKTSNPKSRLRYLHRKAVAVNAHLAACSEDAQAEVLQRVLESRSEGVRKRLRELPVVARERFLAVKAAFGEMKAKWWTPMNWLELRLKKYLSTRVFTHGHKIFSKHLHSDGIWRRSIFMAVPGPRAAARKDGIFGPLFTPSVFRQPQAVASAQVDVLSNHHFQVSDVSNSPPPLLYPPVMRLLSPPARLR